MVISPCSNVIDWPDRTVWSTNSEGGSDVDCICGNGDDSVAGARKVWVCALVLLAGAISIGVCVTALEYLHELIESTVAATVLGGGG